MDYLTIIWTNLLYYVFGSTLLLGMFILIVVSVFMFKLNLSLDAMVTVWIPLILTMSFSSMINDWVGALEFLVLGFVIALLMLKLVKR